MGSLTVAAWPEMGVWSRISVFIVGWALALGLGACRTDYDEGGFRKAIEEAYADAHPGWTILRKKGSSTWFHRGDQVDELDVATLWVTYKASGQSGGDFVDGWMATAQAEDAARRKTLDEAKALVIPIIKSAKWVQYQDLGAIGPKRKLPEIRPWRQEITGGVFVVLGIPEEKLGYRIASIAEVERSADGAEVWLARAIANLGKKTRDEGRDEDGAWRGVDIEIKGNLKAFDLANVDGISGMLLDESFRSAMLEKFARDELGAAAPIRNVLIIFDPDDFVAVKPARNRAHQLYDTQNHPGFRGLLKFDAAGIGVLEPGDPGAK